VNNLQIAKCTTGGVRLYLYSSYCTNDVQRSPRPKLPPFVGVDGVQFALTPTILKRRS